MAEAEHRAVAPVSLWRRIVRPLGGFLAWWFAMFALLGPLSTCPICGQPGCGGSAISAGVLGGVAAAVLWLPRRLIRAFRNRCGGKEHTR
jgi:hypothetical protein